MCAALVSPSRVRELVVAHLRGEGSAPVNGAARAFLELLTFFET